MNSPTFKCLPLHALNSIALGDPETALGPNQDASLTPLRAARVARVSDGRIELAGPWIELGQPAPRSRFGRVFDCFFGEVQTVSVVNLPYISNDLTTNARGAGASATRLAIAFAWDGDGNGGPAQCYILLSTFEDFAGCNDPSPNPGSNLLGSVIYDFGTAGPLPLLPYPLDLTGTGFDHPMPADGHGSYSIAFLHELDPVQFVVGVYPLFSNTGDDDNPPTARPGTQAADEFHDDDPLDGEFTANECDLLDSPTEIGVAIYFETKSACACTGDVDEDGEVDIQDMALLLGLFGQSGPFEYPCADVNNDGSISLSDLTLLISNFGQPC